MIEEIDRIVKEIRDMRLKLAEIEGRLKFIQFNGLTTGKDNILIGYPGENVDMKLSSK